LQFYSLVRRASYVSSFFSSATGSTQGVDMNLKTSPLIDRLETRYGTDGQLAELGYPSVFDVSRVTRQQFIREHHKRLKSKAAGALYDHAMGYAQQVAFRFRQRRLTRLVKQTFRGPFSVPGPSYDEQFPTSWTQMSAVDAIEANTSPAAYLVSLYKLVMRQESNVSNPSTINSLAKRRPDIPNLIVDNDSVNRPLPTLTLINNILSRAIEPTLPTNTTVDETLAVTYYPNRLPYHFAYQQVTEGFAVSDTSLTDVMQQVDVAWPYFINPMVPNDTTARVHAMRFASPLSPPLQSLLIAQPYFSTHRLTLKELTVGWGSQDYSTTELTPWADLKNQAYITPKQPCVASGPTKLEYGGETDIPCKIQLAVDGTSFTVEGYHQAYFLRPINDAEGMADSPYCDYPKLGCENENNFALNLKNSFHAQFFIRMQEYHSNKNYTDISFTLILGDGDKPAIYNDEQIDFYKTQFGISSAQTNNDYSAYLSAVTHLTNRTGLSVVDLESLLCTRVGGDTVTVSPNVVVCNTIFSNGRSDQTPHMPYHYGAVYLHGGKKPAITIKENDSGELTLTGLTDDRLDRLNRLVRMQRVLNLPFDQLDYLITSGMRAEGVDPLHADGNLGLYTNTNTTRLLGAFGHYQQRYGASAEQFAAVVHQITPYAITPNVPLLDRVFNSKQLFDQSYTLDWKDVDYTATATTAGKNRDARIVKQLAAGLKLTGAEFVLLADLVAQYQGNQANHTFPNSLDAVSALYRLATLPRWLGLTIASGLAFIRLLDHAKVLGEDRSLMAQLAGVPAIAVLDDHGQAQNNDVLDGLMLLSIAADWLHAQNLSVAQCAAWLLPLPSQTGNQQQVDFIHQLSQGVARSVVTSTAYAHAGAPASDTQGVVLDWAVLMTQAGLVDAQGLVQNNEHTASQDSITQAVQAVVDQQALSGDGKTQASSALSALIYNAQQSQQGILASTLAQLLGVPQALARPLVQWAGSTPSAFLSQTLAQQAVSSPQHIDATYLTLLATLLRGAQLVTCFQLSPAMLNSYLAHPDWWGDVTPALTALSVATLYHLGCYRDWLHQTPCTENDLLAYLGRVNDKAPPSAQDAAPLLATLLGWEASEVQAAAAYVTGKSDTLVRTVPQIATVMRLQRLSQQTGLAVTPLTLTVSIGPSSDYGSWQQLGQAVAAASEPLAKIAH
jgi:hypothetical protein